MTSPGSIVYVTGPHWTRDASYHRALALARAAGSTLAVLSDTDPGGPRPPVIARALPANTALVIRTVTPLDEARSGLRVGGRAWMRTLPCSVWLLRPEAPRRSRVVVAAVELREDAPESLDEAVLGTAVALAAAEGANLVVTHAWGLIGEPILTCPTRGLGPVRARRVLAQVHGEHRARLAGLLRAAGRVDMEAHAITGKGDALRVIRDTIRRVAADTLVLGYRGRSGVWGALRGNLAESFLGTPGLSVLTVRPDQAAYLAAPSPHPATSE